MIPQYTRFYQTVMMSLVIIMSIQCMWLKLESNKHHKILQEYNVQRNSSIISKCHPVDIYNIKTALVFSEIDIHYRGNILWMENTSSFSRAKQLALFRTESWIHNVQQHVLVEPPHWWPPALAFKQFPMFKNEAYDEGLWCPPVPFHTEIRIFNCITVDTGSVHPSAIGGLATKDHIISHDTRLANPPKDMHVVRVKTLAVPGTIYYPEAPGHFPNEIMPKLLSLHEHVPLHVPILWPDTALARMILEELKAVGEFKDRQIWFHNTAHGLLYVESAYVHVYANDRAHRNNYAGASIKQLQSLHSLFRRVTTRGLRNNNSYGIVIWMRKEGSVRSIRNVKEILNELKDWDINCISHDSSLPYFEQASILRDTHVFISPHGAGMNNVLFLPHGATAIEVVYSDPSFRCPEEYYCLCSAIGVEYYMTAAEGDSQSQLRVLFPSEIREIINNSLTKHATLGKGVKIDTHVNKEPQHQKSNVNNYYS